MYYLPLLDAEVDASVLLADVVLDLVGNLEDIVDGTATFGCSVGNYDVILTDKAYYEGDDCDG